MELEKQLRPPGSLDLSPTSDNLRSSGSPGDDSAPVDEAEVKQIQEIIKEFSHQLPPGMVPPDMGGISHEAIARALRDPEVRQKAEQLMEQYARNGGELPPGLEDRYGSQSGRDPMQAKRPKDTASKGLTPPGQVREKQRNAPLAPKTPSPFPNQNKPSDEDNLADSQLAEEALFKQQQPDQPQKDKGRREIVQSMEDLLKQMDESQSKRSALQQRESMSNGPLNSPRTDGVTRPSPTSEIKKQLDEKGFGSTLRSIVEEARRSAEEQSAKSSANTPSDQAAIQETPNPNRSKGARNSPPNVSNSGGTSSAPTATNKPNASKNDPSPPTSRNENSWGPWLSKVLTDLNESVSKQAKPSVSPSSSTPDIPNLPTPAFGEWRWPSPWIGAIVVGLIGCLLYWMYGRRFREQMIAMRENQRMQSDLLKMPDRIQNRADVVRAFHQLAHRIASPVEDWWTHRMIARQACRISPAVRNPLEIAVGVYEHARYLPVHVELTNDQLDAMRQAVKDCEQERK
jgi:hypothetical protein